jgi:hypothetical protein
MTGATTSLLVQKAAWTRAQWKAFAWGAFWMLVLIVVGFQLLVLTMTRH